MNGLNLSLKDNLMVKAIAFFGLATIALYLLTEHRAHLLAYSSFIVFGIFILMHFFMHPGHGEHGESGGGHGGHVGCCGGYSHGKHNNKETEQKGNGQETGRHEDTHKHKHSQEKLA